MTPEQCVRRLIKHIGDDPDREGLAETPARVVRSYGEIFSGYGANPASVFKVFEDGACDEMVLVRNAEFYSVCEHHMQPFFGKAHIAYVPNGKVIGVSKLVRLLEVFARRLQIQERICQQVTAALDEHLKPKGSACILEAKHFCLAGDSRVQLAFMDRGQHPNGVPIRDLVGCQNIPVYSYDTNRKQIVVGNITNVWKSGRKPIYRVTYEWFANNQHAKIRKTGSIKVTDDHPFMLRKRLHNHYNNQNRVYEDGDYLSIIDGLSVGDSLMPFTCTIDSNGYSTLHLNNGETIQEHRFLLGVKLGRDLLGTEVSHHQNENPLDNSWLNLELVESRGSHSQKHMAGVRRGPTGRPAWNRKPRKVLVCEHCGQDFEVDSAYMERTRRFCSRSCALEHRFSNHRITSIELVGEEDVFDLEVEDLHNFAANEVIVHNCMTCRGVNKQGSEMVTSSLTGVFQSNPAARQELLALIRG